MMQGPTGPSTHVVSAAPVLSIGAVSKRFGTTTVLENCSLDVAEGEIVTLLGPSGCGKTTLLRCIAGFWDADDGKIGIDGQDMAPVPVNRRPVGVVFQSYALFPHMTVAQNVGYALRMRGTSNREADTKVNEALTTVSLTGFEKRYPAQLSGGQQQRVAIARVLVMEPRVLLLDEPFNALDAKLRGAMQVELRQLIKELGLTSIFVTHDQEEALTMSDRIAVMRAGKIEQVASPDEIFDRPATAYVADFIGTSNFWDAQTGKGQVLLPDGQTVATDLNGPVCVMARPHNLRLARAEDGDWTGRVMFHRNIGPLIEYHVDMDNGEQIRVVAMRQERTRPVSNNAVVSVSIIDPENCAIYPD
ncbi:ABC transporter ATP-binding protein [Roseobacter sp.]|uniref:ABC transporter ATP-binding protein n=1 Tax=Roseobacter sp. TaxID=1907202 RepID=UPI00385E9B68